MDANNVKSSEFSVYTLGGNDTAILEYLEGIDLVSCAKKILESNPEIEQVGLVKINNGVVHLEMMGGEFCVNAGRAAAVHYLKEQDGIIKLKISGYDEMVEAEKKKDIVSLLIPENIVLKTEKVFDGNFVEMSGISFIVTENVNLSADQLVRNYYRSGEAFGVIYIENLQKDLIKINPYIWVKETGTFLRETACGSGSVAACLHGRRDNKASYRIVQPSGSIYEVGFLTKNNKSVIRVLGEARVKV